MLCDLYEASHTKDVDNVRALKPLVRGYKPIARARG